MNLSTNHEDGSALKILAGIIASLVLVIAYFILKSDPIASSSPERDAAVSQVKTFATFINQRPEIARAEVRPVYQMATRERPPTEVRPEYEQEINARLNEALDDAENARFLNFLRSNSAETILYFKQQMSSIPSVRDLAWEQKIRTMLKVAGDAEFPAEGKSEILDLVRMQLLNSRTDKNGIIRQHTDEWFEEYLRTEPRLAEKNTMVAVYREKVIQAGREFQDGPETRQTPDESP